MLTPSKALTTSFIVVPEPLGPKWKYCFARAEKIGWQASNTRVTAAEERQSALFSGGRATGNSDIQDFDSSLSAQSMERSRCIRRDGTHLDHDTSGARAGQNSFRTLINAQNRLVIRQTRDDDL